MSNTSSAKHLTGEVFGTILDFVLWQVFLVGASIGKSGPQGVTRAFHEADDILSQINHKTLYATWHNLRKSKLITYRKRNGLYNAAITEFGYKKLSQVIPQYHINRPWDGKIYIISYDIPENEHSKRDKFRFMISKLGCKLLTESTWLTPYNPRQIIRDFVIEEKIPGTIIVSDIGRDGGVGEEPVQDLIVRLYRLEELNDRYEDFLKNTGNKQVQIRTYLLQYLSILRVDPQLPFPLLPEKWLGEKAYQVYQNLQKNSI